MPGNPEPNKLFAIGCLVPLLAVLLGVGSLLVHWAIKSPVSPYQVEFSPSGKTCSADNSEDSALILDQDTGEVLYCSVLPPMGINDSPRARGAFSAAEVGRVTELSRALASDNGFSEADQDAVRELVAQISQEHGHTKMAPTLLEDLTWIVGLCGLIGGLAVLIGLGLWSQYKESQD